MQIGHNTSEHALVRAQIPQAARDSNVAEIKAESAQHQHRHPEKQNTAGGQEARAIHIGAAGGA